jgi:hypothetical protein
MKVVNIFKHRKFLSDENVIDGAEMLSILRKPDTARVRNDWHTKSTMIISIEREGISTCEP